MAHSKKDAVQGHAKKFTEITGGACFMSSGGQRWAKKFNRREARRETKDIERRAFLLLDADVETFQDWWEKLAWEEAIEDFFGEEEDYYPVEEEAREYYEDEWGWYDDYREWLWYDDYRHEYFY